MACCLSSAGRWPFVLGNSLPWNCKSGFWELRTESGMDHVDSTYLWTNLMIPCPCHIASPWQSEPRVWAPDVWVLAQSSNCLLITQGSPSRHELLTRWAYILTLVGLTGWTGSWWRSRGALGRGAPVGSGESQKSEVACLNSRYLSSLLIQAQDLYSSSECPGLPRRGEVSEQACTAQV